MQHAEPIAVVGLGGLFPGAPDLRQFWRNIVDRRDAARDVPAHRWIVDPSTAVGSKVAPDGVLTRRGCFLDEVVFDPSGLDIDPDLIRSLDPLFQIVLHVGREAFLDAQMDGIDRERVGVVLAAIALPTDGSSRMTREILGREFEQRLFERVSRAVGRDRRAEATTWHDACVTGLPAGLLATALRLGGGSYTLDAACASSLYAVKLACDELREGRADAMLAGGVSRPECLYTQMGFSQLRALSPSGCCRPFDARADGLLVGEGAGLVLLKRVSDAVRDGDHLYGVIRGIGLSNDIGGSLLAPDSEGQLRAMREAYAQAEWSPGDVDLVECHGTGTPTGDAVELASLKELWSAGPWREGRCAIGSVKSNIGHLLTAAGAAGLIKTLLAMREGTLPPSANFDAPGAGSPIAGSPFHVQRAAEPWARREGRPRRAAVSAFGFGGINAHVLVEEWERTTSGAAPPLRPEGSKGANAGPPIAIVGMAAHFGSVTSVRALQELVLRGETAFRPPPRDRWHGCEGPDVPGAYIEELSVPVGRFKLPPAEIEEILPQQLLMLQVGADALADAGMPLHARRPRMGAVIGMALDLNTTHYHLRWMLERAAREWAERLGHDPSGDELKDWIAALRDAAGPALNATRTVGALGGIIASRIAREFEFGGASFGVSNEDASGLRAVEIAVRSLQRGELDAMLVGAVDLPGDIRSMRMRHSRRPYSSSGRVSPFDGASDGTLPGEGAGAVVLKRLSDATYDGDRIYAVIRGIGSAGGGNVDGDGSQAYISAMRRAHADARVSPESIGYVEAGSGDPRDDLAEAAALREFFASRGRASPQVAIGSVKASIGHAGAAAGLASLIKTSVCLFQEVLPPMAGFREVRPAAGWTEDDVHVPVRAAYWLRDRCDGPRRAMVGAMGIDGTSTQVVLEEAEAGTVAGVSSASPLAAERSQPAGAMREALFVVTHDDVAGLLDRLRDFENYLRALGRPDAVIERLARQWHSRITARSAGRLACCFVALELESLLGAVAEARESIGSAPSKRLDGRSGAYYSPDPLGPSGQLAFVYPGSGNHYTGMGRALGVAWPQALRELDADSQRLAGQLMPRWFAPWRMSWSAGWEQDAARRIAADCRRTILGQVSFGIVVSDLLQRFGVRPHAVIGYSLGETTGLFALRAWRGRDDMLGRIERSDLFRSELAGSCDAARRTWGLGAAESVDWCAMVVNRPAQAVRAALKDSRQVYLLIVNTPDECVIGGRRARVRELVDRLGCEAIPLDGVSTVHCEIARDVGDAYRELHLLATTPPAGVRFYSAAWARAYDVNRERAAASITDSALHGFDFPAVIKAAYHDGVRVFVEVGPQASCTRMIDRILDGRPHVARSACGRGEDEVGSVLRLLAGLLAERVPVDVDVLYGSATRAAALQERGVASGPSITVSLGRKPFEPPLPRFSPKWTAAPADDMSPFVLVDAGFEENAARPPVAESAMFEPWNSVPSTRVLMDEVVHAGAADARAHQAFLGFADAATIGLGRTMVLQSRILEAVGAVPAGTVDPRMPSSGVPAPVCRVAFDREQCLEFARGSVGAVLGREFAVVDTHPTRVRLPDEPLMLVDRIMSVDGAPRSLKSGRLVTEHDVIPGAWYLDADRAPVCISVEAGQADLFLSAYLGIDFVTRGLRTYRLLDATVTFHRGLPRPGETIRYEITIDKFVQQGDTWLFFFRFDGTIDGERMLTMRDGCAGFFTRQEIDDSRGIVLTDDDVAPAEGRRPADWKTLARMSPERFEDAQIAALRRGDLAACFGEQFSNLELRNPTRLPGGRMTLIDRIVHLDPSGGRFGLGLIRAEADVHPDDWYLTCHFVDDMVMPGTLMYECCEHTLRVFLMRMGWVGGQDAVAWEPVPGVPATLRCRGPVTCSTRQVTYEIEVKELGYGPEPYAIADALMYADGKRIVRFENMSLRMSGMTRQAIESLWRGSGEGTSEPSATGIDERTEGEPLVSESPSPSDAGGGRKPALFDTDRILAFAVGRPSAAFGEPYRVFDGQRRIARLPGPPYQFLDRITEIERARAFVLEAGARIEAQYDVPANAWYFAANRQPAMPFSVILEIALQPCGWLAAYLGSALRSDQDLSFRNLGGTATLHEDLFADAGTLTTQVELTSVSEAGGMIIQNFDFAVRRGNRLVYDGTTMFGFFSQSALAQQVGIRDARERAHQPTPQELARARSLELPDVAPQTPEAAAVLGPAGMGLPGRAYRMVERLDVYVPDGGPHGLGYAQASQRVNPADWFFKAHFYQDPVWPGSLGLESFLQVLKIMAVERWGMGGAPRFGAIATGRPHRWLYRGQIIPGHQNVVVEASVKSVQSDSALFADGFLSVDGTAIYEMADFGIGAMPS